MKGNIAPSSHLSSFLDKVLTSRTLDRLKEQPNSSITPSIPSPNSTPSIPSTDQHHGPTFSPSLPTLCARSPTSPDIPVPPLAIAVADSLEPGSADFGPEVAAQGYTSPPSLSDGIVRSGAWNMRGFVRNDHCRLREEVI